MGGMPRTVALAGFADSVVPLSEMVSLLAEDADAHADPDDPILISGRSDTATAAVRPPSCRGGHPSGPATACTDRHRRAPAR